MRWVAAWVVLVLLGAACSKGATSEAETTSSTTTSSTTTSTTRATTTSHRTTTTQKTFVVPELDEGAGLTFILMASLTLDGGPYSRDLLGDARWAAMLRDGAIGGCTALFGGAQPFEAMREALLETPARTIEVPDWGFDEQQLADVLVGAGADLYCPDLAPFGTGTLDALRKLNAWAILTGGEIIDEEAVILDGIWTVGADIKPGTYSNSGSGDESCYWARLSGFGGTAEDIIANGISSEQQIVTIEASDVGFQSSGCTVWFPQT